MVHNPAVAILLCVNTSFELSTLCLRVRECTITPPVSSTQLPECHKRPFVALSEKCGTILWHYKKCGTTKYSILVLASKSCNNECVVYTSEATSKYR